MYFFMDESGYGGDYVFVILWVRDLTIVKTVIKKWRNWIKQRIKGFNQNEYHDTNASDAERKRILSIIAEYAPGDVKFWVVIKPGYKGNHKQHYVTTMVQLLKHCKIKESDVVIAVDKVEKSQAIMDKYIRKVKKEMEMPELNLFSADSEKEKGIQVADAVAGAVAREYLPRSNSPSCCDLIIHLIGDDVKRL